MEDEQYFEKEKTVRVLKLVPPHWVKGMRRNSKLLLFEASKLYVFLAFHS